MRIRTQFGVPRVPCSRDQRSVGQTISRHQVNWRHGTCGLPGEDAPIPLSGDRRCPPDDVGSLSGFEEFLEAMADPKHPEHEAMTTWYGGPFDPADIDAERINAHLAAIARRHQRGRSPGRA